MDVNISFKRAYMKDLLKKSNYPNASALAVESIALMDWALSETIGGRIIVALDIETERARPIISPALEHAKRLRAPKEAPNQ